MGEALKLLCPAEMHLFIALHSQRLQHAENASMPSHDKDDDDDEGDSD